MPTHPLKYPSLSRPGRLLLALLILSLTGMPTSRAWDPPPEQITPETKGLDITISLTSPPTYHLYPGSLPVEYFEAKEPVKSGNSETYESHFPFEQMTFMQVKVAEEEGLSPPIGYLLIYQDGKLLAACPVASSVVENKPAPNSKKDASTPSGKSTVFLFSIPWVLTSNNLKFELERFSLQKPEPHMFPPGPLVYWFYVKDFLPKP